MRCSFFSSCLVRRLRIRCFIFFFFNDTATTEIYTLSLHDALPIFSGIEYGDRRLTEQHTDQAVKFLSTWASTEELQGRSEEHTSELQSHLNLVCRLLLEKKKKCKQQIIDH